MLSTTRAVFAPEALTYISPALRRKSHANFPCSNTRNESCHVTCLLPSLAPSKTRYARRSAAEAASKEYAAGAAFSQASLQAALRQRRLCG
jgi:hypothetical protein